MARAMEQEIVFTKAAWNAVRGDERLWDLLRLGRVVHSLTLAQPGLTAPVKYQTPRARRSRAAGLVHAGAVVFEGLQVSRALAKHFRGLPQFKQGFGAIHSDPATQELESRFLKPLRDKAAFHFDRMPFTASLMELDLPEYRFASSAGWSANGTYFDIVDDALFLFLTGAKSNEQHLEELGLFMVGTATLVKKYLQAANRLMPPVLASLGATMRPLSRGSLAIPG